MDGVGIGSGLVGSTTVIAVVYMMERGYKWWQIAEHYLGHPESECPLYDESVDVKCRAEMLMKELGIEMD